MEAPRRASSPCTFLVPLSSAQMCASVPCHKVMSRDTQYQSISFVRACFRFGRDDDRQPFLSLRSRAAEVVIALLCKVREVHLPLCKARPVRRTCNRCTSHLSLAPFRAANNEVAQWRKVVKPRRVFSGAHLRHRHNGARAEGSLSLCLSVCQSYYFHHERSQT